MAKINNISINSFRGICNLSVNDLSHVNLIVGDNNCGKTSILEALQLLRAPEDINNIFRVSRIRDAYSGFSRMPIFDSFINMLQGDYSKALSVSCDYQNENNDCFKSSVSITGSVKRVMFDINELSQKDRFAYRERIIEPDDNEIDEFEGNLVSESNVSGLSINPIKINRFTNVTGRAVVNNGKIKINYLSPVSHVVGNTFDRIIRNEKYKEICITMLKMFDENIDDLLLLRMESSYRPIEYVKNRANGLMPLSTYGDGIKKVLAIANAIAQAANGILLIDEIETAIHSKYYDDIFRFIIKASVQYNVQLFITTHSIEAVDGLLNTQTIDGEYSESSDLIKVITLRKDSVSGKTMARSMTGKEVFDGREKFDFEVRI